MIKALQKKSEIIPWEKLTIEDLWIIYGLIIKKFKDAGAIRTKNITAERGEQLAIQYYNKTKGLPTLQAASQNTKNLDALSIKGDRYSIKTVKIPGKLTGVFWGMGTPDNPISEKKFDYLIIVVIDEYYQLKNIYEIDWDNFFRLKRWHSRMKAYNISITQDFCNKCKIIFKV